MSKKTWPKAAIAAVLAAFMAPVFATTAQADPLPPATGDLVIHKYIGLPVSGGQRDGTELNTTGWTGVTAVNGVAFDLYKIGSAVAVVAPDEPWPSVPPVGDYIRTDTGKLEVYSGSKLVG